MPLSAAAPSTATVPAIMALRPGAEGVVFAPVSLIFGVSGAEGVVFAPKPHAKRYFSAPNLHWSMQLKQSTQREWSMCSVSLPMAMHCALQCSSQALQCLHLSWSIRGRNMAKRERKLSVVPTGQMLLQ